MQPYKKQILSAFLFVLCSFLNAQQTFYTLLPDPATPIAACVNQTPEGNYFCSSHGFHYYLLDSTGNIIWSKRNLVPTRYTDGQFNTITKDHGYIISGLVFDLSNMNYPTAGSICKLDSNGNVQWFSQTGTVSDFTSYTFSGIEQTVDSGYVIAGGYSNMYVSSFRRGGLALKTDKFGNIVWSKVIVPDTNVHYQTQCLSVKIAPNGDYIFAGLSDGAALLSRIDPNGNVLWIKTFFTDLAGTTVYTDICSDGGIILCGSLDLDNDGSAQTCLLKTDSTGNLQWCKLYGSDGQTFVKCVRATTDGGLAFLGLENSMPYTGTMLAKTDVNGNMQWATKFDTVFIWDMNKWSKCHFDQCADQGYVFGGGFFDISSNRTIPCIIKTDPNGEVNCISHPVTISTTNYTPAVSTIGYSITGENLFTASYLIQPAQLYDSLICSETFVVHPEGMPETENSGSFSLYPNPANDFVLIETDFPGKLEIYNANGQLVATEMMTSGTHQLNISRFSQGMYCVVIDTGKMRFSRRFIRE